MHCDEGAPFDVPRHRGEPTCRKIVAASSPQRDEARIECVVRAERRYRGAEPETSMLRCREDPHISKERLKFAVARGGERLVVVVEQDECAIGYIRAEFGAVIGRTASNQFGEVRRVVRDQGILDANRICPLRTQTEYFGAGRVTSGCSAHGALVCGRSEGGDGGQGGFGAHHRESVADAEHSDRIGRIVHFRHEDTGGEGVVGESEFAAPREGRDAREMVIHTDTVSPDRGEDVL